ncbi:hypothetical protein STBA_22510 [Streptomyces sp. MP131-18]|nr:hypothetical protein STBA_22510 [Streptomyces sp. MP131-18]
MFTCPLPLNKGQDGAKAADSVKTTIRREGYVPR